MVLNDEEAFLRKWSGGDWYLSNSKKQVEMRIKRLVFHT